MPRYRLGRPIVTAVLVAYGLYSGYAARVVVGSRLDLFWTFGVTAVLSLGAAAGLFMNRPWSRFIVYLLGISYSANAVYVNVQYARVWAHDGVPALKIGIALFPGAMTITLALLFTWLARCQFVTRGI